MSQETPKIELTRRQKFAKKTQWITWLAYGVLGLAALASLIKH